MTEWGPTLSSTLSIRTVSKFCVVFFQPLLEEFQGVQRKRLKAAVGAVLAANRLHKFLRTGQQDGRDKAASHHGDHQPEEKEGDAAALAQGEAGMNSQDNGKMP